MFFIFIIVDTEIIGKNEEERGILRKSVFQVLLKLGIQIPL